MYHEKRKTRKEGGGLSQVRAPVRYEFFISILDKSFSFVLFAPSDPFSLFFLFYCSLSTPVLLCFLHPLGACACACVCAVVLFFSGCSSTFKFLQLMLLLVTITTRVIRNGLNFLYLPMLTM